MKKLWNTLKCMVGKHSDKLTYIGPPVYRPEMAQLEYMAIVQCRRCGRREKSRAIFRMYGGYGTFEGRIIDG